MRITSKGQVTIPLDIRRRAGFMPGTDVAIVMDGEVVKIVKQEAQMDKSQRVGELTAWLEKARGSATAGLTTDEIMEMTRGRFNDLDPG